MPDPPQELEGNEQGSVGEGWSGDDRMTKDQSQWAQNETQEVLS